jgi:hypothetical protein
MKIRTWLFSFLLFTGLVLTSCTSEELIKNPSRTLLVYMAADNNLSSFAYDNIKQMLLGAEGDNLNGGNLLVYLDSSSEPPQLFQIKKGLDGKVEKELIRNYDNRNSVSIEVMQSVLAEVFDNEAYRADSYGLLLWSHGTAWLPADLNSYLRSYGQDKSDFMEIYELQEALGERKFDFIIFDDCYMANVEVAYTLRKNADYILASPTEVLAPGLPYHQIIKYLFSRESLPNTLSKAGETFYTFYEEQQAGSSYPKSATIALVKTSGLEALSGICREILRGKEETIFELQIANIQLFERLGKPNHSLFDFADYIKQLATDEQYARFEKALNEVVPYKKTTDIAYYANEGDISGFPIDRERFCGITSYVPQRQLEKLNNWYKQLDWYKAVYQ